VFIFSEILSKYDCFAFNISLLHLLRIFRNFSHCPIVLVFLLFNDYFCKQADLNDSETSVPDITDILINGLEQITVTENEVEDILKILDTSAFNISLLHLLRIFRNFSH
jgi:hypothetical protein